MIEFYIVSQNPASLALDIGLYSTQEVGHLDKNKRGKVNAHIKCFLLFLKFCMWAIFIFYFFPFIFISWRLITLQYCSGFCHTLT